MRVQDWLAWTTRAVLSNRQRSFLTALGIAVGISAVALLTSIGEGVRVYLLDSFSQFGTRIVTVTPGKAKTKGMVGMLNAIRPLSFDDADALRRIPDVTAVVPVVRGSVRVEFGNLGRDTQVQGSNHEGLDAYKMSTSMGRYLPIDDDSSARNYVVLGSKIREELFPTISPLGQFVRVGGQRFRVIGVMSSKGNFLGIDLDDMVHIPAASAMQLLNRDGLMQVDLMFTEATTSAEVSERVKKILLPLHGKEDFTLFTQEDMLGSLDRILSVMTKAVAALGGIALLVGAVGVLTIMMVSLKERTGELGLLRALGCTTRQTLIMFLGEAVVLASFGGLAGLSLVVAAVLLFNLLVPGLPLILKPLYLLGAWCLSSVIGLIAGIYPAWKAAQLDPIEALRHE
jgi:putative ABC transport system permease protein